MSSGCGYLSEGKLAQEQAKAGLWLSSRHKLNVLRWIPCEHWEDISRHWLAIPSKAVDLSPYVQKALDDVAQLGSGLPEQPGSPSKSSYDPPSCSWESESWYPAAYPPVLFFPAGTYTVHDLEWDGRVSIEGEHISATRLQYYDPAAPAGAASAAAGCATPWGGTARSVLWVPPWEDEVFPDPAAMGSLTDLTLMGYHPGGSFSHHLLVVGRPVRQDLRLERLSLITCRRDAVRLAGGVECGHFDHLHASGVGGYVVAVEAGPPGGACPPEPLAGASTGAAGSPAGFGAGAGAASPCAPRVLSITRMRWFSALPPGALIDYEQVLKEDFGIEDPAVQLDGPERGKLLEWGCGLVRVVDQPGLRLALRHVTVIASTRLLAVGPAQRALVRVEAPRPGAAVEGPVVSVSLHDVHGQVRPDDHVLLVWSHNEAMELLSRTIRVRYLAGLYLSGDASEAAASPDTRRILPPDDDGLTQLTGAPHESAVVSLQGRSIEMLPHGMTPRQIERRCRGGDLIFRAPPVTAGQNVAWVVVPPPRIVGGKYQAASGDDDNNGWWGFGTEMLGVATVLGGEEDQRGQLVLPAEALRHFTVGDNLLLLPPSMVKLPSLDWEYEVLGQWQINGAWACHVWKVSAGAVSIFPVVEEALFAGEPGLTFHVYRRSPGLVAVWNMEE